MPTSTLPQQDAPSIADPFNLNSIQAIVAEVHPMPWVQADWIVMNATRPLLGDIRLDGDGPYLSGRYYAAIDPAQSTAEAYVAANRRLDASMVFVADKETQTAMALQLVGRRNIKYVHTYQAMGGKEREGALSTFIQKLNRMPYGELTELALGVPASDTEPEIAPPYDENDMDAAVAYARETTRLFRAGNIDASIAHYLADPNGGAVPEFAKPEFAKNFNRAEFIFNMQSTAGGPVAATHLSPLERQAWAESGATDAEIESIAENGGYAAILKDSDKLASMQNLLDHLLQQRAANVTSQLREKGWYHPAGNTLLLAYLDAHAVGEKEVLFYQTLGHRNVGISNILVDITWDVLPVVGHTPGKQFDFARFPDRMLMSAAQMADQVCAVLPYAERLRQIEHGKENGTRECLSLDQWVAALPPLPAAGAKIIEDSFESIIAAAKIVYAEGLVTIGKATARHKTVLDATSFEVASKTYNEAVALTRSATAYQDIINARVGELPQYHQLVDIQKRAHAVEKSNRSKKYEIFGMRKSGKRERIASDQETTYQAERASLNAEIAAVGFENGPNSNVDGLALINLKSYFAEIIKAKVNDKTMRTAFEALHGTAKLAFDHIRDLQTAQRDKTVQLQVQQISANNFEAYLAVDNCPEPSHAPILFSALDPDKITFDNMREFGLVEVTNGFGKTAGKSWYKLQLSVPIEDPNGVIRNGLTIKIGSDGTKEAAYASVNEHFAQMEALKSIREASASEKEFLAAVLKTYYLERGRGMPLFMAGGLLSTLHGTENVRGALNYAFALRPMTKNPDAEYEKGFKNLVQAAYRDFQLGISAAAETETAEPVEEAPRMRQRTRP